MAILLITGIAVAGWVVMLLWNWLMPNLFMGVQQVSYCQALGILLLSKILFGSCRGHGRCGRHHHQENMTPEERDQIKSHFKSRWSNWCNSDKADKDQVSNAE